MQESGRAPPFCVNGAERDRVPRVAALPSMSADGVEHDHRDLALGLFW